MSALYVCLCIAVGDLRPADIAVGVRSLLLALLNRRKDVLRSVNILVYIFS